MRNKNYFEWGCLFKKTNILIFVFKIYTIIFTIIALQLSILTEKYKNPFIYMVIDQDDVSEAE